MKAWQDGEQVAWGKLERDEAGVVTRWHPLPDHMADVAACFLALSACHGMARALERAAGRPLSRVDLERLAVLVFLHDFGKANAGFQGRRWLAGERAACWPIEAGHVAEALQALDVPALAAVQRLGLDAMMDWGDACIDLLLASLGHHGRPARENLLGSPRVWQPVVQRDGTTVYDPGKVLQRLGDAVRQQYPLAFSGDVAPLPAAPAFTHLFAGLVQLADWLGSDTRFFPYSEPDEPRLRTAVERARQAVVAIGLDADSLRTRLQAAHPDFCGVFDVPAPRPIQTAAAEPGLAPMVILESETGSGKTEAALWRFARLFEAGLVDSLYFALPTRVAATQLYERVFRFCRRLWPQDPPAVVRALPGYEAADEAQKICLPHFQVLWTDDPDDGKAHRRWAAESPKRFLAATVAVGTIDQALLGALQVRHAHLRHALLSRCLLVVDEVHASDAYMGVLLETLLAAHLRLGGQALLLSATLGAVARTRYQALLPGAPPDLPALEAASQVAYPLLSDGGRANAVAGNPRQKTVHWQTLDALDDPARIASLALDAASQQARVLVIRNTVPAAVATQEALEMLAKARGTVDCLFTVNGISTLHHSRFSRQDRPLLDCAVEVWIGKVRERLAGCVVIGTQTLEQSLDLDADLLITDLCPMDVLLQRIGRLHRHDRPACERPDRYRQPQAFVLTPPGGDLAPLLGQARHGLGLMRMRNGQRGGVYPDLRMLEATRRLVEAQPSRDIPAENRLLVEQATHPESLSRLEDELGADWRCLGQDIDGMLGAGRSLGRLQALPFDQPFEAWDFPEGEKIATRLGAADRLVEFPLPPDGPFGEPVRQLAIRHHQLPAGLDADALPSALEPLASGGFAFSLGTARYCYQRYGLIRMKK